MLVFRGKNLYVGEERFLSGLLYDKISLTSLFLPVVLGIFSTTLFFDEHKNDTLKALLIIPVSKTQLYFSKVAVGILMSMGLSLLIFVFCIVGGLVAGGFPDFNAETVKQAGFLCRRAVYSHCLITSYLFGGIIKRICFTDWRTPAISYAGGNCPFCFDWYTSVGKYAWNICLYFRRST